MKTVYIPRPLATHLLSHAQKSPEQEVCGLIGQYDGIPSSIYPIPNIATNPQQAFAMDEKVQLDAFRQMRDKNEELFAIYHSHPNSPAQPSSRDLVESAYPEALYLIISLDTKGVLNMRGFYLLQQKVEEIKLSV